ncbi:MAG: acetate--CoA ligase family protein [Betaproteobacteria bacterium]
MNDLSFLLAPRSIAILGASEDFSKVNGRTLKYLLAKGYAGAIYPINPKYRRIGSLDCYPTVAAIPEAPDLAVVALPAPLVARAITELGQRGGKSAIVFSSGFAETGEEGRRLERDVISAARSAGVRLCGPNCLGLINAFDAVMATFGQFAEGETPPGPVAFVTQSGAFGTAIAALARRRGIGLGYFINTGNEGDVDFVAAMRAVLADPRISVGAGYLEGLKDGAGLMALAEQALALGKPLVITKVGKTGSGARAALSHTGSLAGADSVFDGAIRSAGVIRARNEEHMLDIVEALAGCRLPQGRGVGIITQSGGAGVLMADRAEELALSVPVLGNATQQTLRNAIPVFGAVANPVDVTGQFVAEPRLLHEAIKATLSDPQVHVGIVWLQLMDAHVGVLVEIFKSLKSEYTKPFVVSWVAAPEAGLRALRECGIPVLRGAEPAIDAAAALVNYADARRTWEADADPRPALRSVDAKRDSAAPPSGVATGAAAMKWLNANGIATIPTRYARTSEEAAAAAVELGFPVALKVESPDIPHKTEVDGVRLHIENIAAVRDAYSELTANAKAHRPEARLDGVAVQKMAGAGVELVIGLKRDPAFGLVVMAGLGGIHIEVLRDVAFRVAPVTPAQAGRMLHGLRGAAILGGTRKRAAVNRAALERLISDVSALGAAAGNRLRELDLNPVIADATGAAAVDWLLVMD